MKRTIFTFLVLVLLANLAFAGYGKPLTIYKTSKAPKIDGYMDANDPWSSTWVKMTAQKTANTSSSVTAQFQLSYDDVNLYLICQQIGNLTVDSDATAIPNSYERDNFEVYLKMDTASENADFSYETDGTYQFRMQRAAIFPNRFDYPFQGTSGNRFKDDKNFKVAQTEQGTSFIQEWQMPWNMLTDNGNVDKFNKKNFKFEIDASDNTTGAAGGRTQITFWQDNSDNE
jgi:hypothetical protein